MKQSHRFPRTLTLSMLVLLVLPAVASGQSTVAFDPPQVTVLDSDCSTETFLVGIVIDDTDPEVQGFQLFFEFDPTNVLPVAVSPGQLLLDSGEPFFFLWVNEGEGDDFVHVDVAILGATVDGPGELAVVELQKVSIGSSTLDWLDLDFRDASNDPIAVIGEPGMVEILDCSVPVDADSWGRIKQLFR